jgi:hypothetical protein
MRPVRISYLEDLEAAILDAFGMWDEITPYLMQTNRPQQDYPYWTPTWTVIPVVQSPQPWEKQDPAQVSRAIAMSSHWLSLTRTYPWLPASLELRVAPPIWDDQPLEATSWALKIEARRFGLGDAYQESARKQFAIHYGSAVLRASSRYKQRLPLPENDVRQLAIATATSMLGLFEAAFPDDDAPRRALAFARARLHANLAESVWMTQGQELAGDLQLTLNLCETREKADPRTISAHAVATAAYAILMNDANPDECLDEVFYQQFVAYQDHFMGSLGSEIRPGSWDSNSIGDMAGMLVKRWQEDQVGAKLLERGMIDCPPLGVPPTP